jgi:hypothetical protein
LLGLAACDDAPDSVSAAEPAPAAGAQSTAAPVKAESGFIVGRVVGEDGKPIAVAEDISINVYGVSEAGEKVSYSPAVKADGTYRQKLVPGSYRIGRSMIKVRHGEDVFSFPLVPEGNLYKKDRDAADGIEQNFVWKVTGSTQEGEADPNNHTHWHGMSIGMRFNTYRDDLKKGTTAPPAGTKLIFTLTPTSKCIDGRELKPVEIERQWDPSEIFPNKDLNDLPPADYTITGVARMPDGSTRKILLQGSGDYPAFKQSAKAPLQVDKIIGTMAKPPIGFVIDE